MDSKTESNSSTALLEGSGGVYQSACSSSVLAHPPPQTTRVPSLGSSKGISKLWHPRVWQVTTLESIFYSSICTANQSTEVAVRVLLCMTIIDLVEEGGAVWASVSGP